MHVTFQTAAQGDELPPLYSLYVTDYAQVAPFFQMDPRDPQAWEDKAAELAQRRAAPRRQVAAALTAYNESLGAHNAAITNAAQLAQGATLAVVTGQQAGLFSGPLYTIYKAISAIRLARQLTEQLQRPVVPVFWVAGEDHDFAEVRSAQLVDQRGRLRTLRLPGDGEGRSIGHLPVPRRLDGLLREAADSLGDKLVHDDVFSAIAQAGREAASLADWFARIMARWLSPHGLVMLDPMLPELKELARDIYPTALLRREAMARELAAAGQRLQRRGFTPGLALEPDHAYIFRYVGGRRVALFWRDGQLTDREGRPQLTVSQLSQALREQPADFSPNVVLRPIIQDYLLPTAAQVVGPGELLYLAQMREVFPLFGLSMPILVPRLSLTLVEPEVSAALQRQGLGAEEVWREPREALRARLEELDPVGIDEIMADLDGKVAKAYADALRRLEPAAPVLQAVGQETLRRVRRQVAYLRDKAWQHHRRQQSQLAADLDLATAWLRPRGQLQERTLTALPFVARYGEAFFRALLRAPAAPGHQFGLIKDSTPFSF